MNNGEVIPSDQFARVVREMQKAARLIEEIQRGTDMTRGLHRYEAQRALDKASTRVEEAQYWLGRAIAEAMKAGKGDGAAL
jgi:hypothetical protein